MSDIQNTPEETDAEEKAVIEETATRVFGEPQTVDNVDGGDVDWKGTAEFLQSVVDARKVYPFEEGDTIVLGPEIFAAKDGLVLNWKGVNYVPQKGPDLQPKDLKKYSIGEAVEVQKNGMWLPGRISSRDASTLNVDTERGPVPVMSYHVIRKAADRG